MEHKNKITIKKVDYSEKYGGDDIYVEVYKGNQLVGKVIRNGYLSEIRAVDLRFLHKMDDDNDKRAYYYPDKKMSLDNQILDATNNLIFILGVNDEIF